MALYLVDDNGKYYTYNDATKEGSFVTGDIDAILKTIEAGTEVRLVLGYDKFSIRKTSLPALSREKLKEILPFEIEGMFLLPSSRLAFDVYPLGQEKGGREEYLVFALEKDTARQYTDMLVKKGINVVGLSPMYAKELADYGITEEDLHGRALNLMPSELKGEKQRRDTVGIYKLIYRYVAAVLLILIIGLGVRYAFMTKKEGALRRELLTVYNGMFPGQTPPADVYATMQSKILELKQNHAFLKGVDVLEILRMIGETAKNGVTVKDMEMDGNRIVLKGDGNDAAVIEQFRNAMKWAVKAQVTETKNMPDGRIRFVIEAMLNES